MLVRLRPKCLFGQFIALGTRTDKVKLKYLLAISSYGFFLKMSRDHTKARNTAYGRRRFK